MKEVGEEERKGAHYSCRSECGRVWKTGWKGTRIVWAKTKVGIVKYAWICIYAPVNVKSGKGREKLREFGDDVNDCVGMFETGRTIVVFGDMNGRVGSSELAGVVAKWGVEGVNENGENLVNICAERGLFLANTFFQHKMIHRYTWRRREDGEKRRA